MSSLTLTEFLLARIAEDEESAQGIGEDVGEWFGARVLAEAAAKRRIIEAYPAERRWVWEQRMAEPEPRMVEGGWIIPPALLFIASVYADDPDFREEWRL